MAIIYRTNICISAKAARKKQINIAKLNKTSPHLPYIIRSKQNILSNENKIFRFFLEKNSFQYLDDDQYKIAYT